MSTPSLPAASSTATSACSRRSKSMRTLNDHRIETDGAARGRDLDQRGGHALHAGHDGLRRVRRRLRRRVHPRADATSTARPCGDELARIGYAGDAPMGGAASARVRRLLRGAHRAGPGARGRRAYRSASSPARWASAGTTSSSTGMDAHAGPTPMALRRDAAARRRARDRGGQPDRARRSAATAAARSAFVQVKPNSRNVIPGFAQLSVDFRHPTAEGLARMDAGARARPRATSRARGGVRDRRRAAGRASPPCAFDAGCVGLVRDAARRLGLPHMDIVSGAGHDAVHVARGRRRRR